MKFIKVFTEFDHIKEKNSFEETTWVSGDLVLNIGEVIDYLSEIGCEVEDLPISKVWDLCVHKDKPNYKNSPRVRTSNLMFPIIVARKNNEYFVLDGHHRIMKAKGLNLDSIKALVFDIEKSPNKFRKIFSNQF